MGTTWVSPPTFIGASGFPRSPHSGRASNSRFANQKWEAVGEVEALRRHPIDTDSCVTGAKFLSCGFLRGCKLRVFQPPDQQLGDLVAVHFEHHHVTVAFDTAVTEHD